MTFFRGRYRRRTAFRVCISTRMQPVLSGHILESCELHLELIDLTLNLFDGRNHRVKERVCAVSRLYSRIRKPAKWWVHTEGIHDGWYHWWKRRELIGTQIERFSDKSDLLSLYPHTQAIDMEDMSTWKLPGIDDCHFLPTDDTRLIVVIQFVFSWCRELLIQWHAIKLENQHEEDLIESSSAQNFESEKLFSSYQIYDQFDHLGNEFQVEKQSNQCHQQNQKLMESEMDVSVNKKPFAIRNEKATSKPKRINTETPCSNTRLPHNITNAASTIANKDISTTRRICAPRVTTSDCSIYA
ncbi:unnamed protein product [Albugo candida]|uniref:Uncharacterized protein n=1 Tax=Albugo candida TaxID=65357 RepID=A0A024GCQ1_9STRA|nr:unnamed protein product [Albugo candida]|eukprot:CCI44640.1 unnamed protein product [Albugo candida]